MVAGITTINVPRPILNKKLANEGVIFFARLYYGFNFNSLRCFMILKVFLPKLKLITTLFRLLAATLLVS